MSVESKNGGLSWKAGIDTSQLEIDAKRVETIFKELTQKQIQEQQKQAQKLADSFKGVFAASQKSFFGMSPEAQKESASIQKLSVELRKVGGAQNALNKLYETGKIGINEYSVKSARLASLQEELNKKITDSNNRVRDLANAYNQSTTAISTYQAKLSRLTTEYDQLSEAERKSGKGTQNLEQQARIQKQIQLADTLKRKTLENITVFGQTAQSLDNLGQRVAVLTQRFSQLTVAQAKDPNVGGKIQQEIAQYQRQIDSVQKYNDALRQNMAVQNMTSGSLEQKRARLALLQTQYSRLTEAELKNKAVGGQLSAQIRTLDRDIARFDQTARGASKGSSILNQALSATLGILTISQGSRLIGDIVRTRGEIEQLEVAFSTMLKSKTAADQLMQQLVTIATETPFTLSEVAAGTKQLLAYGFAQKDIKNELLAIGNIASGVGASFGDIAYAYGTLKAQGRAYAYDIRQFTGRGIPIIAELAKVMNTTTEEVQKLVEAGKIGFPEVQKAFQNLTGAGGQFFNLMEKQSQTVTGEIAKLQDRIQMMYNDIGKGNDGIVKNAISGLSYMVEHYEDIASILATLLVVYGSYRTALIATAAAQAVMGTSTFALMRYLVGLRTTMTALNAAFITSPIGAFTAAITALGLATYSVFQTIDTAKSIQDNFNDSLESGAIAAGRESAKIKDLLAVIKAENASRASKEQAIQSLRDMMGTYLESYSDEEIAAGKATEAIDKYTESKKKSAAAASATDQYNKLSNDLVELEVKGLKALSTWQRAGEDLRNVFDPRRGKTFSFSEYFKYLVSGDKQDEKILSQVIADKKEQMKALKEAFNLNSEGTTEIEGPQYGFEEAVKKMRADVTKYFDTLVGLVKNKGDADKIKEALEETLASLAPNDPQIAKVKSQIQKINQVLDSYSLKTDNKIQKDVEAERKRVLAELNRLEDKAYKRAFDKREQQIEDAKRQYAELRDAAKDAGLGKGVLDRIDRLEEKDTGNINYRTDTEELKEEFDKRKILYQQYETYVRDFGVKAADEKYSAELDIAKNYLGRVQEEYSKLTAISPEDRSGVEIERLRVVQEILEKEKAEQSAAYNQLLLMAQNYNQKREVLESNYQKDRAKIVAGGDVKYLEQFDRSYKEAIAELNRDAFLDSSGFTKFFDNIEFMSRKAALDGVKVLKEELIRLSKLSLEDGGLNPEVVKQLNAQLNQTAHNVKMEIPQGLATIAGELSSIAGLIGDSNKGLSKMLNIMSSVIGNLGKMKAGVLDFKAAQAANDGQGDALGMITSGLSIAGAAVGAVSAIVGIFKTASEKSVAMQKKQLDFQRQIFLGELALSQLYRDRALETAKAQDTTLQSLNAQREVLENSLKSIDDNIGSITSKFGTGIEKGYLDIINQQRGLAGSQMEKLFEELSGQLYKSGTRKVGGFLGIGKKEIDVYESLAGLSFEDIEQLSLKGQLTEQAEGLYQQLVRLKEEGIDVAEQLKEIEEALQDIYTGGATSMGLADGIIQGLQEGKRAVEDFGQDIEEILRNAVISGLKYKFLEEPLNDLIEQLGKDAEDGLDQSEINKFTKGYGDIISDFAPVFDALDEALSIDLTGQKNGAQKNGIQGGIQRSITEETGAELAGLFRGFYDISKQSRMGIYDHLAVANQQLNVLLSISTNTGNTVERLDVAIVELRSIVKNTKPGPNGHDSGWKS